MTYLFSVGYSAPAAGPQERLLISNMSLPRRGGPRKQVTGSVSESPRHL